VQVRNEPFSTFIHCVREAALVLCIEESEAKVVARIIEGLTQAQRVRFVFEARPTSFADLEPLVVLYRNLACAEQFEKQACCVKRESAVKCVKNRFVFRETHPSTKPVSSTTVVCFSFLRPGHLSKNCPQGRQFARSLHKPEADQQL
jgi:hypothetical protein